MTGPEIGLCRNWNLVYMLRSLAGPQKSILRPLVEITSDIVARITS